VTGYVAHAGLTCFEQGERRAINKGQPCDDGNPCTNDTCLGPPCFYCQNSLISPLCVPCANDTDCLAAPFIDACTYWTCPTSSTSGNGTCQQNKITGCLPCTTAASCPAISDPAHTCLEYICPNGTCTETITPGCCSSITGTTTTQACFECVQRTGCAFINHHCVNSNTTLNNSGSTNCSVFISGDGGDGISGGTIAGIVVPVVSAVAYCLLALLALIAALAIFLIKRAQRQRIVNELTAIGFTASEAGLILDNALYKRAGTGEVRNPLFEIQKQKDGSRIIVPKNDPESMDDMSNGSNEESSSEQEMDDMHH